MLSELCVENLVLIESARLEFHPGLNVFTGETGAGKSLLIDALGLLFGGRGDPDLVRPGATQAEVTACFLLKDRELAVWLSENLGIPFETILPSAQFNKKSPLEHELVVSRVLPLEGRARAHANGRPIAAAALKELGERLLDIHGQHENQSLLRPSARLEILDRYGKAEVEGMACRTAYRQARAAAQELAELRQNAREHQERIERAEYQLKELNEAQLDAVEPEELENELKLLRSAEKIQAAAGGAAEALDGEEGEPCARRLARALKNLEQLGDVGGETANLTARLESLLTETRDLAGALATLAEKARHNPERLAELEDMRGQWRTLERKHGRDIAGLRTLRAELLKRLTDLGRLDERSVELESNLEKTMAGLRQAAAKLSQKRKAAAKDLEKRAQAELSSLGLKGAELKWELRPHTVSTSGSPSDAETTDQLAARLLPANLHATGAEGAEVLFSANSELPPRPLAACASGGELSRVMLALKTVLARVHGADRLPVVVFDEVDSGVGGRLGAALGRKLAALAQVRQVLCVTHLPQVAAYGHEQFKVDKRSAKSSSKTPAVAQLTRLERAQRIEELALMLRGETASERTREEAAEMLASAEKERTKSGSPCDSKD